MENIGVTALLEELKRLNPTVSFQLENEYDFAAIVGSVPPEELILPDGYYYNEKNGINNKHKTNSGLYECFDYRNEIPTKQSWFSEFLAKIIGK